MLLLLGTISNLSAKPGQTPNTLLINELMASNGAGLTDEDGDFPDWIEIYNPTGQPINLAGWALTDEPDDPQKWRFPDMTLPSREYRVIFASGKNRKANPDLALHTNFKLGQRGEFLGLYNLLEERFTDTISLQFPQQIRDIAYGRYGDGATYAYLAIPSPGAPNGQTKVWVGVAPDVTFEPQRGFYNASVAVQLQTMLPEAVIRYTTDGSEPTENNGQIYTGPITIDKTTLLRATAFKPGYLPAKANTHSFIFLDQVIRQPADPPGWPATWGVYKEYYPGLPLKGAPVMADYKMDARIVKDPRYRDTIKEALLSIPSISLVTTEKNFDIYANAVERGEAWERPVSVELIDPNNPARNFQIDAGIRMQGVTARWEYMPKKSFRLFFKGKYGAPKLEYRLFPDSPVDEFDTLVLRGGANESYAGYIDAVDYTQVTYTRDEWMRASQIAMSGIGSHGIFVHLYLNGLYWGLYNVVERPDAAFASSYLGGDKTDWFAAKHGGTILNPEEVAQGKEAQIMYREEISGSNERFVRLLELAERDLAQPENYAAIQPYLDIAHFSDYIILNLYAGNHDWNDNNWFAAIRTNPPGPLRYFVWDAELTWAEGARLYLGKTSPHHKIRPIFLALMRNPDYRVAFADRVYKHLFNDGVLTDANSQARWLEINRPIERAIVGESARWGDVRYPDNPIDQDDWRRARDNVLAQMEGNGARFISLLREASYYPSIDPPIINQPEGLVQPGFEVVLSPAETAATATIFYTIDGSDPRVQVTGTIAPTAQSYTGPIILTTTTIVKVRAWLDNEWSALNEVLFQVAETNGRIQITEIMYNPVGGDDYEFIELRNSGEAPMDLAGFSFEGISFTFPPGSEPLPPGRHIVLARNPELFAERYPGIEIGGVYDGQLSNTGEQITLKNAAGQRLISLAYDDENGWPVSPDGRGDSLTFIALEGDPNDPRNWQASGQVNGTPGFDESALRP
jgi:hypothetical protein